MTRLRHDDLAAFYRMHRPEIVRAVTATIGDADLAAEATDEAFARACAHWRRSARSTTSRVGSTGWRSTGASTNCAEGSGAGSEPPP